ncbi:MAG: OmpA family protein, partial [Pseudomonadota bacterium]
HRYADRYPWNDARRELEDQILATQEQTKELRNINEQKIKEILNARASNLKLQRNIQQMQIQISQLLQTLEASEAKDRQQQAQIKNLGSRLNSALARKVQELDQYRSEFFGRMRRLLAGEKRIEIKGDRFVLQSEVLFESGSADLGVIGKLELAKIAEILKKISKDIPSEIDWILRIDGHTDQRPIATARFPSNWELSSARAISVAKALIEAGVSSTRLAVTGFAHYQPVNQGHSDAAYKQNRRIEIKLTQR